MTDDNSMRDNACRKIFASTAHRLSTCPQWRAAPPSESALRMMDVRRIAIDHANAKAVNEMDGHDDEEALRYAVSAIDEIRQSNLRFCDLLYRALLPPEPDDYAPHDATQ